MAPLLYLVHRIPYPPNKGDKVRSYHLLRHFARTHRVYLGTFVDDPADLAHIDAVRALCADVFVETLDPRAARLRSLGGFLNGEALTLPFYRSQALGCWIDGVVRSQGITRALAFSSAMAQYVVERPGLRAVLDFVDVDSAKWARYATGHAWPRSWLYRREARRLADFERAAAARAAATVFVTGAEAALFSAAAPETASRVHVVPNGVDAAYFAPDPRTASPYGTGEVALAFTGAMDYWPNADAAQWFARDALPRIRAALPAARFYVVGMNPGPSVRALGDLPGVTVTGRVDDVRPYLQHAAVVVAPLRVARGVQNKALEAMAMARPVVMSRACLPGLDAEAGAEIETAEDAAGFAAKVLALVAAPEAAAALGAAARARVLAAYDWDRNLARLNALLDAASGGGTPDSRPQSRLRPGALPPRAAVLEEDGQA